jgi:hypothetical protein
MVRTALTPTAVPEATATDGVTVTMTAADTVNQNEFVWTGREIVIAHNTSADTAYTVTITSQPDALGRVGHITADSLAFGAIHVYPKFPSEGWVVGGKVQLEANNAAVKFGVLRLP